MSGRRRRGGRIALGVAALGLLAALLVLLVGPPVLRAVGRWLVVEEPVGAADVLFVHGGHLPFRAMEAARLHGQGLAPEVWLAAIAPTPEEEALAGLGIEVPQGWHWNRQVLERLGVPAGAIRLLPEPVLSTADEVALVARELRRRGGRRVLLVTSKQHSRRVRVLWNRLAPAGLTAIVRPAADDPFDGDGWWRNTVDAQAVVHELAGILNAWIGSPLRPERERLAGAATSAAR